MVRVKSMDRSTLATPTLAMRRVPLRRHPLLTCPTSSSFSPLAVTPKTCIHRNTPSLHLLRHRCRRLTAGRLRSTQAVMYHRLLKPRIRPPPHHHHHYRETSHCSNKQLPWPSRRSTLSARSTVTIPSTTPRYRPSGAGPTSCGSLEPWCS